MHITNFGQRSITPLKLLSVKSWYEKHFLGADLISSVIAGCLLALLLRHLFGDSGTESALKGNRSGVYAAVAGISGSLLGFTMAMIPLTRALLEIEGMRTLRGSPHTPALFLAFVHALLALAILALIALSALLLDTEDKSRIIIPYTVLVFGIVVIWKLARSIRLMWTILALGMRAQSDEM